MLEEVASIFSPESLNVAQFFFKKKISANSIDQSSSSTMAGGRGDSRRSLSPFCCRRCREEISVPAILDTWSYAIENTGSFEGSTGNGLASTAMTTFNAYMVEQIANAGNSVSAK
jgi:hypothetical protein